MEAIRQAAATPLRLRRPIRLRRALEPCHRVASSGSRPGRTYLVQPKARLYLVRRGGSEPLRPSIARGARHTPGSDPATTIALSHEARGLSVNPGAFMRAREWPSA